MAKKKVVNENFKEPDVKWKESKAKRLLYKDIVDGEVPMEATGADGRSTMPLSDIYAMHPEFAEYAYNKFSSRLSSLRAAIVKEKTAKEENEKFKEPKVKWKKSKARRLLYKDIVDGEVPMDATGTDGQSTMQLSDIYLMHHEYAEYGYEKFSSRLSSLRKIIKDAENRAQADQEAFENYKNNHPVSLYSHKGYIQWQGSEARELLLQDMEDKLHETLGKKELYGSRREYYKEFPLSVFRDKIYQEQRTAKYVHTCVVMGKLHKTS
jgi:hypothetical protein